MDTALHIAVRKSSTSVAERIRSHGDLPPEALGIRNKVCACQSYPTMVTHSVYVIFLRLDGTGTT